MKDKLPEGTVTFLFTDIAGSTRLLHELGDAYAAVLADQRDLVRAVVAQHQGQEVDTQGDAFFVAFPRAGEGVAAAAEIQRALNDHQWPGGVEVRVRMGLHTGEPVVAREGYVGMDVHRAARIAHVGHGGQVLLSESVVALVRDQLTAGVTLRELGEHLLKDLSRPEPIYQLVIPGLRADFPPLNSLDARPNNLPVQLTSFIGRQEEIRAVKSLLEKERLVTVMGPGGMGKTRLSLQVAAEMADQFPHGVWFVELAPVTDPKQIVMAVVEALNFYVDVHSSDLEPGRQLLDYLSSRSLLLVLDNFEHLLDGAGLVEDLLTAAPQVKVLITSRERLNTRQEWVYAMDGLAVSENGSEAGLAAGPAVELFQARARQEQSGYALDGDERKAAIQVCKLLEGMPLGIELAAAWTSMLSCQEIAAEIQKNLDFLTTSMRGIAQKHRSLRAVFDTSWSLLAPPEQAGFRKLSLFRESFSHQAASQVAGVNLPMLSEFIHKSLVRRNPQGRFEIHEVLRQYAEGALMALPEEMAQTRERHGRFFFEQLGELLDRLKEEDPGKIQLEMRAIEASVRSATFWIIDHWEIEDIRALFSRLEVHFITLGWHTGLDTFREITNYLEGKAGEPEGGAPAGLVRASSSAYLALFMSELGLEEAEAICQRVLPELRREDFRQEVGLCLLSLGICAANRGAYQEAVALCTEALKTLKQTEDYLSIISGLLWLGWAHSELGAYDLSYGYYSEAYEIAMDSKDRAGLAYTLSKLGTLADIRGAHADGLRYHQQALETFRQLEDSAGQGYALSRMAWSAWGLGNYEEAFRYGLEGYERFSDINHPWGIATSLSRIGFAEVGRGDLAGARSYFLKAVERSISYNILYLTAYALIGLGFLAAREGKDEAAIELLAVALTYPIMPAPYKLVAQKELEALRARTAADVFGRAWDRGETADFEEVIGSVQAGELSRWRF